MTPRELKQAAKNIRRILRGEFIRKSYKPVTADVKNETNTDQFVYHWRNR